MRQLPDRKSNRTAEWTRILGVIALLAAMGVLAGRAASEDVAQANEEEAATRAVPQQERAKQPGKPAQSARPGQPDQRPPTFPQQFNVQGPEAASLGFAVTQPGPVVINVQAQGAPIVVTLQSPGIQPMTQKGTGALRLNYNVTPQDVQRSLFWTVQVRGWCEDDCLVAGKRTRSAGSIMVQHPPIDEGAVRQSMNAMAARAQKPSPQAEARVAAQIEQAFQQRKVQFEQSQQQRRAALFSRIQPQVDQLRNRAGKEPEITSRAVGGSETIRPFPRPPRPLPEPPAQPPQPATVNPAITSLSMSQGQPGDPVMITGTDFGSGSGEIHFVIAPGRDLTAPAGAIWSGNQIFTSVPVVDGVMGFNGHVYVKRASDQKMSNLAAFRFEPALEIREIRSTMERLLREPIRWNLTTASLIAHGRSFANPWVGDKNNDEFLMNVRLKNGWISDGATVTCINDQSTSCNGGVYVWETRQGTDSPYLNVRWWLDPDYLWSGWSKVRYQFAVRIIGPKGVTDGVVVP